MTYSVTMKTSKGVYKTFKKDFTSHGHLDNWVDCLERKYNWKLIGIEI